ncbi:MAG: electron transfer flavoprotein subunit beta/FixA family protein [Thermoleophilia bacterium]|nr:electron transfer flavoprotein subunit beta/FixA family protein [Thermoleophilia bacterium]
MHSVVCVKQVPDTTQVRIDPETGSLIRQGIPSVINPFDLHAIEAALAIRDRHGGLVTALCMGPPQAEESLRKVLGYGADRAVLLTDRAFAGADTLATTQALAVAIRKIGQEQTVDLVICGKQSIDGDTGQVGPGLARRLDLSQLTYVCSFEGLDLDKSVVRAWRQREDGRELMEADLPAALTVTETCNRIRYASLPAIIAAEEKEIETWTAGDLEVDRAKLGLKGSPTRVKKIFGPPPRQPGEILTDTEPEPSRAAQLLMDRLQDRGLKFTGGGANG